MLVWVSLDGTIGSDEMCLLSPLEVERARRFERDSLLSRFVALRVAARHAVAHVAGCRAEDVRIERMLCPRCGGGHGPPMARVPAGEFAISLSRSGQAGVVAITDGISVGVDVELNRPIDWHQFASRIFTPGERQYLASRPPSEGQVNFLRCWTRKEAVGKAAGLGLAIELRALDVRPDVSNSVVVMMAEDPSRAYRVTDVSLPVGMSGWATLAEPVTKRAECHHR